ncbi:synaptic vesicle 2-related protein [Notothenia coriiceps]|uniref:Synaptic vesicle 2-related protein n=1 Tax=Notothenia coriiceps TaxID=8208 RepID=A0A6I9PM82_9TELE|nr:PREDICTED: synaptic vesicle 2-related protein [Notothenia coriiceps]
MDDDLFQLRQLPVVRFRRTGESIRSEDDGENREQVIRIAEQTDLESVALTDGAPVPREFANPTDDTFMVEDAVEAIGFGTFQWKLSILTGLAWMADAMEMMILCILAPQLHCEWKLSSLQVALLTSAVFIGMMLSSSLWGNISDKYGRKTGLTLSVLWTMFYGVLSAFAPVYGWILVLRALVGFGIGGAPQSVTLYAEFLPMRSRATCILLIESQIETVLVTKRNKRELGCNLECKYLNSDDYKDLLWTTLSEFPGLLVTLWAIDRLGRRKTMALCFFVFSMCIIPLYGCVGRTSMTVLIFIARAFIAGGFQAAYVYTPEVYPTATRALGLGMSSGMARVGALITPFVAQVMLESSVHLALSVYCCCCLLAAIASCALPIETTGRGLQESTHREWGQEMVGQEMVGREMVGRAPSQSSGEHPPSSSGSQG